MITVYFQRKRHSWIESASSKSTRKLEMKTVAAIVGCLALSIGYTAPPLAGGQPQGASAPSAGVSAKEGDELHFVSVLTLHGEVVAIDPANRFVTVRDPNGHSLKLEVRSEKDLESRKAGDRVVARYFEGAQIDKKKASRSGSGCFVERRDDRRRVWWTCDQRACARRVCRKNRPC